jgi:hypothetical protein
MKGMLMNLTLSLLSVPNSGGSMLLFLLYLTIHLFRSSLFLLSHYLLSELLLGLGEFS